MTNKPFKNKYHFVLKLLGFILLLVLAFIIVKLILNKEDNNPRIINQKSRLFDKHNKARQEKQLEFTDTLVSPFNKEEIQHHKSFKYFDIDEKYNVKTKFTIDTTHPPFEMSTTTDRKPIYRIYGYLNFSIADTSYKLTAYQNMGYKNHPEHGKYLFVPFTDLSNGKFTYGGGRYLDILIPSSNSVFLDFNETYNPYCAYSERWSCPLVPFNNHLNTSINAGEKKYK